MSNCLVTKLKGVVDNDNLSKLGVIRIPLMANMTSSNWRAIATPIGTTVSPKLSLISGNFTITNAGGTATLPHDFPLGAAENIKVTTGATAPTIEIDNKYSISSLGNILNKASAEFSCKELEYLPLTEMECSSVMIQDVVDIIIIQTLTDISLSGDSCVGDFSELGKLVNLTNLNCYGVRNNLVGTIEDFVTKARAAGRTTGSVSYKPQHYASTITYEGSALDYSYTWTIAWTADSISVTH